MSVYSVAFAQAITVASDLLIIAPADDRVIRLRGLVIGQSTELSEQSPSQAEQLGLIVARDSTAGTGASSVTPAPLDGYDVAFGSTCTAYSTAQGTPGTVLHRDAFNVFSGYQMWWEPEFAPTAGQSLSNLTVSLAAAPSDSVTFHVTGYIEEI